eukprot:TRINITY_DN17545_c0_g1_i4.p1 TRINITY_DN17545_c0_g1~~TRINITY_DN17545_c0_g1_i4.p1  ORF type:complete len:303 (+),score=81.11 TRINITY_DN17545_c0_g1_i4:87-995(+)
MAAAGHRLFAAALRAARSHRAAGGLLGAIAGCGCAASASEPDSDAELQRRTAATAAACMPHGPAQRTRVVRFPGLLSDAEVEALIAAAERLKRSCGVKCVDKDGVHRLNGHWETAYLHTGGAFHADPELGWLRERLLDTFRRADEDEGWGLLKGRELCIPGDPESPQLRTCEYHKYRPGAGLADLSHCDNGSLLTIDLMLTRPGVDYTGGHFATLEADNETLLRQTFERGDAVVFVSTKRHCVLPVQSGLRAVFVAELWLGERRECAHRCVAPWGPCAYTLASAYADRVLRAAPAADTVDPF